MERRGHLGIGNYAVVYAIKLRRQRPRLVMPDEHGASQAVGS